MDLIESEKPAVAVAPEPRYVPETARMPVKKTEHGHTWFRLILAVIFAVILIVLIVVLARWAYHQYHHKVRTIRCYYPPNRG